VTLMRSLRNEADWRYYYGVLGCPTRIVLA
jgi:hypothetical protein